MRHRRAVAVAPLHRQRHRQFQHRYQPVGGSGRFRRPPGQRDAKAPMRALLSRGRRRGTEGAGAAMTGPGKAETIRSDGRQTMGKGNLPTIRATGRAVTALLAGLVLGAGAAGLSPAAAQSGSFAPAIHVNDEVITRFEIDQRIRFLEVLRLPGDPRAEAEKSLIEDRLRRQAARLDGITVSDRQITAGMAEFASRASLELEPFLEAIGEGGVAAESFRDFVHAGIAWREVVRARFAPTIRVSEAEIDRAMSIAAQRGAGPRVLLSEIVIPVTPANALDVRALADDLSASIGSEAEFARAARAHSAAPSRETGGQLDWIPLTNLPPQLRQVVLGMANGQVSITPACALPAAARQRQRCAAGSTVATISTRSPRASRPARSCARAAAWPRCRPISPARWPGLMTTKPR
ncbi:MAG: hypothetical protein CVT84_14640 [Alphaproteobacteria bacterium HGW-Alphaproteobacteria-6]|nr:MAG: hypothetical protein CVT84_14640 [Alphaproteobacteria bacterium HGW-Alphaproteobacteria-6]